MTKQQQKITECKMLVMRKKLKEMEVAPLLGASS
jgi:hypothetical protein